MQRLLADRNREINRLRAQQQDQVKELEESASETARAEVKLRRFATEADVASRLAEVEVAMEDLRAKGFATPLQVPAQRLLDAASTAFNRGEFNEAADLAAQSEQLIDMLIDIGSMPHTQSTPEVPFKIAIPLKTKANTRLRRQPDLNADIVTVLQPGTTVVARAYHGQWLRVETQHGGAGWILGELLEAR